MNVKNMVLLMAALITMSLAIIVGVLYGGSQVPIGIFRNIEKEKTPAQVLADGEAAGAVLRAGAADATNGTIPSLVNDDVYSGRSNLTSQKNITEFKSNGTVRINNFA